MINENPIVYQTKNSIEIDDFDDEKSEDFSVSEIWELIRNINDPGRKRQKLTPLIRTSTFSGAIERSTKRTYSNEGKPYKLDFYTYHTALLYGHSYWPLYPSAIITYTTSEIQGFIWFLLS
jgi:hypothetical protein